MTGAAGATRAARPDWIEPELATLTKDRFSSPSWMYERKLDGERCLAFRDGSGLRLMTRNQKHVTSNYPELAGALRAQRATDFIIDGEIVAFTGPQTSFAQLQQRMSVADPPAELLREVPVQLYLFDVLLRTVRTCGRGRSWSASSGCTTCCHFGGPLCFTEHRAGDGEAYYAEACRQGWEGLIAKRADAPYRSGPDPRLAEVQVREQRRNSSLAASLIRRAPHRAGCAAARLLRQRRQAHLRGQGGHRVSTSGCCSLLHEELARWNADRPAFDRGRAAAAPGVHWTEPRLVAQVGFSEWTTGGQLRHPRFQGLRRDKSPAEVIREVPQPHG